MLVLELGAALPPRELVGHKAAAIAKLASMRTVTSPPGLILIPESHLDTPGAATWHLVDRWLASWKPEALICRSSTSFEDLDDQTFAGHSLTSPRLTPDKVSLTQAVSALSKQAHLKAIIIQSYVDAIAAGVAFDGGTEWRAEGGPTTDWVTSGKRPTFQARMDQGGELRLISDAHSSIPALAISRLLRYGTAQLRHTWGDTIDVEWGFKDGTLFIFQVRPVTALGWEH